MRQHPRHSASASVPTGLTRALAAGAFGVALLAAGAAQAVVFPATPNLSPYAIVSVGAGASLTINSGPVTGKVLVGNGSSVSTSGGGNGSITGGAFADTSALLTAFNGLQFDPVETLVSSAVTTAAFNQAVALQNFLDGLGTTQTFGAINSATTITGGLGGLNVIQFSSLQNADLTISGSASDIFVLRTAGNINTNHVMTLSGGVTANHIIWDLGGTTGNIFQTSGGNQLYGTFLATKGGDFQFSALHLTGQLINTDGHIQFVSNSTMTAAPFTPPSVPEPATWAMMLIGFGGLGAVLRRRRAAIA